MTRSSPTLWELCLFCFVISVSSATKCAWTFAISAIGTCHPLPPAGCLSPSDHVCCFTAVDSVVEDLASVAEDSSCPPVIYGFDRMIIGWRLWYKSSGLAKGIISSMLSRTFIYVSANIYCFWQTYTLIVFNSYATTATSQSLCLHFLSLYVIVLCDLFLLAHASS
jgi:hypothetical protein